MNMKISSDFQMTLKARRQLKLWSCVWLLGESCWSEVAVLY